MLLLVAAHGAYGLARWRSQPPSLGAVIVAVTASGLSFGLISAVLAAPLAEFVHSSDRTALSLADSAIFSLPPLGYAAEPDLASFGPDVFSAAAPPPPAR